MEVDSIGEGGAREEEGRAEAEEEGAGWQDDAPLNAVEGFVRQVIGWREFIRGVYWLRMPELRSANLLGASRRLPSFYWRPRSRPYSARSLHG